MIKTRELWSYPIYEKNDKGEPKLNKIERYVRLDQAINDFIEMNNITPDRLIDIKYGNTGYFNGDEGEIESTALLIYKTF